MNYPSLCFWREILTAHSFPPFLSTSSFPAMSARPKPFTTPYKSSPTTKRPPSLPPPPPPPLPTPSSPPPPPPAPSTSWRPRAPKAKLLGPLMSTISKACEPSSSRLLLLTARPSCRSTLLRLILGVLRSWSCVGRPGFIWRRGEGEGEGRRAGIGLRCIWTMRTRRRRLSGCWYVVTIRGWEEENESRNA